MTTVLRRIGILLRSYALGIIIAFIYRVLWLTWRIEVVEPPSLKTALKNRQSVILAHWHGDEIALLHLAGKYRITTITSTSKDGELMDKIFRFLGGQTTRGSSTRGGIQALKGLIRKVKLGSNCSFAVDGPKGPIYKVKPGVLEVSKLLTCPIFTAGVYCDKPLVFPKSWNKTYLPKPFAKIRIYWTGPWGPLKKSDDPRDSHFLNYLEDELHSAKQQAIKSIAVNSAPC